MTATPPRADLRTLAASAIREGQKRFLTPESLADAVLAAVLPEHRRLVAEEIARAIDAFSGESVCQWTKGEAVATARDYGETTPETTPDATETAEIAPPVPEDTPGGFYEPDEPTDEVVAAFDAGIPGRTAPPRGQTQWLDLAQAGWQELRDRLAAANAGLQKDNLDLAAQVAHYQRLHERPDIPDDLPALRRRVDREQAEQRVIEAAKAWYAACDPRAITAPDVRAAGIQLGAALDALCDADRFAPTTPERDR